MFLSDPEESTPQARGYAAAYLPDESQPQHPLMEARRRFRNNNSNNNNHNRGSHRPHRGRYQPSNPSYRLSRSELREFAELTLKTLDDGVYTPPGAEEAYDLAAKIISTNQNTFYYSPDDADVAAWATSQMGSSSEVEAGGQPKRQTKILIREYSTLVGARKLHGMLNSHPEVENKTIGVLNFASAKKPGGGFINGAQAQEESIARSSTLYPSLISPIGRQFYAHYNKNPDNAYYTHAMIYSPAVVIIRNDKGNWKKPIEVDVLTSAAVNAGEVRDKARWDDEMRQLRERVRKYEEQRIREELLRGEEEKERERLVKEEGMERLAKEEERSKEDDKEIAGPLNKEIVNVTCEGEPKEKVEGNVIDHPERKEEATLVKTDKTLEEIEPIVIVEEPAAPFEPKDDVTMVEAKEKREETESTVTVEELKVVELEKEIGNSETVTVEEPKEETIVIKNEEVEVENEPVVEEIEMVEIKKDHLHLETVTVDGEEPKQSEEFEVATPMPADPIVTVTTEDKTTAPLQNLPDVQQTPSTQAEHEPELAVDSLEQAEEKIKAEMYERIARLLYVFHKRGAQHLILGSFGTGVFQNSIELVASIFFDLLVRPDAKFNGVFDTVVFAILGGPTIRVFKDVFGDANLEHVEGENEFEPDGSEVESMKDGQGDGDSTVKEKKPLDTSEVEIMDGQGDGHPPHVDSESAPGKDMEIIEIAREEDKRLEQPELDAMAVDDEQPKFSLPSPEPKDVDILDVEGEDQLVTNVTMEIADDMVPVRVTDPEVMDIEMTEIPIPVDKNASIMDSDKPMDDSEKDDMLSTPA